MSERWDGDFVPPMLAVAGTRPFDDPSFRFELKWDGWRALAGRQSKRLKVWSRSGHDMLARFPDLEDLGRRIPSDMLLDGELVSLGDDGRPDFLGLGGRHPPHLAFVAFDVLAEDGVLLLAEPLSARLRALTRLNGGGRLFRNPGVEGGQDRGIAFYQAVADLALEGVMAKRLAAPYLPGQRSDAWLKLPVWTRIWLRIVGVVPRQRGVSLILTGADGAPAGQVTCDAAPPSGVATVLVETRGRTSDGRLRHARIVAFGEEESR